MTYYTYIHAIPDGNVFYVGKGTKGRVYSMSGRSLAWKEIVKNNQGVTMKIVQHFQTEEEAFQHEIALIELYIQNGCKLVNQTSGGKGPMDYCQSEEARQKKSLILKGYKHKKLECPQCGKIGGETSMKRWHFEKCTGNRQFKSRVTVLGKRVYLGYYAVKELADSVAKEFYDFVTEENALLNRQAII